MRLMASVKISATESTLILSHFLCSGRGIVSSRITSLMALSSSRWMAGPDSTPWVAQAGVERDAIAQMALTLLRDPAEYRKMAQAVNPYGDGQASRRIADAILYAFGRTEQPPEDFAATAES